LTATIAILAILIVLPALAALALRLWISSGAQASRRCIVTVRAFVLALSIALVSLPVQTVAQTSPADSGAAILTQIFSAPDVPQTLFADKLLQVIQLKTLNQQVQLIKLMSGEFKNAALSTEPPVDPRLAPLSHYLVSFAVATVDVYLHLDSEKKIDGLLMLPPKPFALEDQSSKYIKPPAGWIRTTLSPVFASVGVQEMFLSPPTKVPFRQNINIIVAATDMKSLQAALDDFQKRFPFKLLSHHEKARQCGRFQAQEIDGEGEVSNGKVTVFHSLMVLADLKLYQVTYSRLKEQSDDIDAIESVDGFCNSPLFGGVAYSL
jgi:hypothetical protein